MPRLRDLLFLTVLCAACGDGGQQAGPAEPEVEHTLWFESGRLELDRGEVAVVLATSTLDEMWSVSGVPSAVVLLGDGFPALQHTDAGWRPKPLGDGRYEVVARVERAAYPGTYPITLSASDGTGAEVNAALELVILAGTAPTAMGVWQGTFGALGPVQFILAEDADSVVSGRARTTVGFAQSWFVSGRHDPPNVLLTLDEQCSICPPSHPMTFEGAVTVDSMWGVVRGDEMDSTALSLQNVTAALRVVTSTTGSPVDPDGYSILIGGSPSSWDVTVNDTLFIEPIVSGAYSVSLSGIALNCFVLDAAELRPTLEALVVTEARFDVVCEEPRSRLDD